MKISEFKNLVREEIIKTLKEDSTSDKANKDAVTAEVDAAKAKIKAAAASTKAEKEKLVALQRKKSIPTKTDGKVLESSLPLPNERTPYARKIWQVCENDILSLISKINDKIFDGQSSVIVVDELRKVLLALNSDSVTKSPIGKLMNPNS